MAVQRRLNCSPEQVFAVLCDGWTYPVWVVGASRMRSVSALFNVLASVVDPVSPIERLA